MMARPRDIGRVAAERLSDPEVDRPLWVRRIARSDRLSPSTRSPEILSEVLGRKVDTSSCDPEECAANTVLHETAISENLVDRMLEMYEAVETGRCAILAAAFGNKRPRRPRCGEFVQETMLPMIAQPVANY